MPAELIMLITVTAAVHENIGGHIHTVTFVRTKATQEVHFPRHLWGFYARDGWWLHVHLY